MDECRLSFLPSYMFFSCLLLNLYEYSQDSVADVNSVSYSGDPALALTLLCNDFYVYRGSPPLLYTRKSCQNRPHDERKK